MAFWRVAWRSGVSHGVPVFFSYLSAGTCCDDMVLRDELDSHLRLRVELGLLFCTDHVLAQMASRYRGVSKPEVRGQRVWLAQHKEHPRVWKKGFSTQDEAAQWLAKALGVKKSSLLRVPASQRSRVRKELVLSSFRGIVLRHRAHGLLWEARQPGGTSLGCYSSQLEAAKALARVLGVPVMKLRKKRHLTRSVARKVFKAACQVFKKYVPGDLEKTTQHETTYRRAFKKDIFVVICVALSKLHPHDSATNSQEKFSFAVGHF